MADHLLTCPVQREDIRKVLESPGGDYAVFDKMPEGPACLEYILQDSTFNDFYMAARYLAESPLPQAKIVIRKMIEEGKEPWERGLGLILYGSRVAAGKSVHGSPMVVFHSFLISNNRFLRFCAVIGLLRTNLKDAERFLDKFAKQPQGKSVATLIQTLMEYKQDMKRTREDSYVNTILFGWADSGTFQTEFFRHHNIAAAVAADFQEAQPAKVYTVWDVGCATGLTSETLRIVLKEQANKPFLVIGTDVSPFALVYAERGKYLLETESHAAVYNPNGPQTEIEAFRAYAQQHNLDADNILRRNFEVELQNHPTRRIYLSKRKPNELSFVFDDITSQYSAVPDGSVDVVVYANVHYLLDRDQRPQAIKKIEAKLKEGGKVFVIDRGVTYEEFEVVFGKPIFVSGGLRVYRKL